jgi:hypothetical protein
MSLDTVEDAVQSRIERYVMDAFIANRSVDPQAVAEELIRSGATAPIEDLSKRVRTAATGLGVRLK